MQKIWPYAWAFSIMCILYAVLKVCGVEWAAERPWYEVIIFLGVAIVIITCFFLRKKIAALVENIKNKNK